MTAASDEFSGPDATLSLLRAGTDALLDPQVLLVAVKESSGQVVDFLYREVNQATCDYLGLSHAELIGRRVTETMPGIQETLLPGYIRCLDTGEPLNLNGISYNELLPDARRWDLRATRATATSIVVTWRDVTERLESAARIADSELKYRLLVENTWDVVCHVRDGKFVWVAPSIEGVLGGSPEYWVGRSVRESIPSADLADFIDSNGKTDGAGVVEQRIRLSALDGIPHWFVLRAKPFYSEGGHRDGHAVTLRVIDDEVAAEQALEVVRRHKAKDDERYLRSINNAGVGMYMVTPEGRIHDVNDAMGRLFGYDAETMNGMRWQDFTSPEYLERELNNWNGILEGRIDSYRMITQYIRADGHLIWGDLSVSCIRGENGQVEDVMSQITDITAQVRADERNLVLAQTLQQQSDQIKAGLDSAAAYMKAIMPSGLHRTVEVSSRYLPSQELGGDSFDYRWMDDDHLLVKLIDVSGHGIEPALLAASVHNLMRSGSLSRETLLAPETVLTELNRLFAMDQQGDHYITIWYGVYEASTRILRYASAGAPPALAFNSVTGTTVASTALSTRAAPIGVFEDTEFTSRTYQVPRGCRMLLYSDGASEITLADGRQLTGSAFADLASRVAASPEWSLDDLLDELRALTPSGAFEDDCSLIQVQFD
jgi:sigma-B regulation protein RsbU (phosphoserine phosphatase)